MARTGALKIVFYHPFLFRLARGIERAVVEQANELVRQGHSVEIVTWRGPLRQNWQFERSVHIRALPTFRYLKPLTSGLLLLVHLLTRSFDWVIIHFADFGEAPAVLWSTTIRQKPYMIVLHYPANTAPHRYTSLIRSGLWDRAAAIVPVSSYVNEALPCRSRNVVRAIGHGIDCSRFRPDPGMRKQCRSSLGLAEETLAMVSVAALDERKGIQWAIRSLRAVEAELTRPVVLLLAGEGTYRPQLEHLVNELQVRQKVIFLGERCDVEHLYQCSDVCLLLAHGEAFGLAPLEAAASGCPVITSRHPPFPELIHEPWGKMVDETNPQEIVDAVRKLLMANEHGNLSTAARQHVEAHHSWHQAIESYLSVFRECSS